MITPEQIEVPEGIIKAIRRNARYIGSGHECLTEEQATQVGVAVCVWLANNPIEPTEGQLQAIANDHGRGKCYPESIGLYVTGFQRRMFLKPETPSAIKELLISPRASAVSAELYNNSVREAYEIGRRSNNV